MRVHHDQQEPELPKLRLLPKRRRRLFSHSIAQACYACRTAFVRFPYDMLSVMES
jgi:hypothetical protein